MEAAERSEAEALYDFEAGAPAEVQEALGMSQARIGGGVVLSMRDDPLRFWSKALGFEVPVTAELIEEVVDFYRAAGTPIAELMLAPSALPEDWPEICAKVGLTAGGTYAKLGCAVDAVQPAAETRIDVAPVHEADAGEWATTLLRGYEGPVEEVVDLFASLVDRPNWQTFGGRLDGAMVSTGALYVRGDTGHCFGGATLPRARGLGGQTALLAARARAAERAGCRWLFAETGAERPGSHNSSLHNMLRLGFEVLYERQSWYWRPASTAA